MGGSDTPVVPTLVIVNAKIWTGDRRRPWADALAVRGKQIVALGASAEMRKVADMASQVVDVHGMLVVPGRIDALHAEAWIVGPDATPETALRSFMRDNEQQVLARNTNADFVLLDRDVTHTAQDRMNEVRVMMTVIDGQIVYQRNNAGTPQM